MLVSVAVVWAMVWWMKDVALLEATVVAAWATAMMPRPTTSKAAFAVAGNTGAAGRRIAAAPGRASTLLLRSYSHTDSAGVTFRRRERRPPVWRAVACGLTPLAPVPSGGPFTHAQTLAPPRRSSTAPQHTYPQLRNRSNSQLKHVSLS